MRKAVFAGSFDPFTIGHADILSRGLAIFDHIIVCVGINMAKEGAEAAAQSRAKTIRKIYEGDSRISVACCNGITAEFARAHGACALLRGVRSVKDFEYERDLADANRALLGVETVILYADPSKAWVSSSLVRELKAYGRDVRELLP